ncbi:MAG: hypothetical protein PHW40_00935 [Candidatus Izemoplasmatales bacterium]|nr:hypothetical protein [Candidatus Izemoplasmatales bacterium]MDD5292858.1 hypothetical protein [Candidatus Izemoplasmatales bacterium]
MKYFANPILGTSVENPCNIIRYDDRADLQSYSKTAPFWQDNRHERIKLTVGDCDHVQITEEEAMAIIERWAKELPVEEAIANLKQKAEESMKRG